MPKDDRRWGRSLKAGEVALEEIRELTRGMYWATEFVEKLFVGPPATLLYDVAVVDGDLEIDGNLDTFERGWNGLVVRGSLRISGLYRDYDDPATGVFVRGDLHASRIITVGGLCVAGTLSGSEVIVGAHNDYSARIGKDVVTPCFFGEEHFFEIGGQLRADLVLGTPRIRTAGPVPTPLSPEAYRARLVPEVLQITDDADDEVELDAEVDLDAEAIQHRVAAGLAITVLP